jgi:hypothetical protein
MLAKLSVVAIIPSSCGRIRTDLTRRKSIPRAIAKTLADRIVSRSKAYRSDPVGLSGAK